MKKLNILLLITASVFVTSCFFEDNDYSWQERKGFTFPLKVGNRWEYVRKLSYTNFRPDSIANSLKDTLLVSPLIKEIVMTETLKDSIDTYVFHERSNNNDRIYEADTYYHETETGLYLIAYHHSGELSLKPSNTGQLSFKGMYFNSVNEIFDWIDELSAAAKIVSDSLYYEYHWPISLKYPLDIGMQWTYRPEIRIDKKVEGVEKIHVPAGTFTCYKIRWLYDMDQNGVWDDNLTITDYICSKGLISRYIQAKNVSYYIEDYSDPAGIYDIAEEYHLVSYSLK
jgi:hypothetical protein